MDAPRIRPQKLAHVVVRTSRYRKMVDWYRKLLEADAVNGVESRVEHQGLRAGVARSGILLELAGEHFV